MDCDAVPLPGRLEFNLMEGFAEGGILLNQETLENLRAAARQSGINVSELDGQRRISTGQSNAFLIRTQSSIAASLPGVSWTVNWL